MKEDFFSVTAPKLPSLNESEQHIYEYIVHNIHSVKDESIRSFAHDCFVSTTTMFRFVQKLGFSGYADFINLLRLTDYMQDSEPEPPEETYDNWETAYLDGIEESIRNITAEDAKKFAAILNRKSNVILISDSSCYEAACYARRIFCSYGIRADAPAFSSEYSGISQYLKENDVLWVFSFAGQENTILECVERLRSDNNLFVVTFTNADSVLLRRISNIFALVSPSKKNQAYNNWSLASAMIGIDRFFYYYRLKAETEIEEV